MSLRTPTTAADAASSPGRLGVSGGGGQPTGRTQRVGPVSTSKRSQPMWRSASAHAAALDDPATIVLLAVGLVAALGLGRIFAGTHALPYLAAGVTIGHVAAWAARRSGLPIALASVGSGLLSMLTAIWLVLPQTTTYGIPTPHSIEALTAALGDARSAFNQVAAPTAPTLGFLAAGVLGVTLMALLADWAAFRMRGSIEAVVPHITLIVFGTAFGARTHATLITTTFAFAALSFLVVHHATLSAETSTWFGGRSNGALRRLTGVGALAAAVAVAIGAVVAPHALPSSSAALIDMHHRSGSGTGDRSTISPLVDIRARLVEFKDVPVFTVTADRPAYWRLTALDQFDGSIWSSNERYQPTKGRLGSDLAQRGDLVTQQFAISGLASIWLPAAYRASQVDLKQGGLSWSASSTSVISKEATTNGLTYSVRSDIAPPEPATAASAPTSVAGRSGLGQDLARYLATPRLAPNVGLRAREAVAGQTTPYGKAKALQDWFRAKFTYSLDVPSGHDADAISRFLRDRRGYCEQFAGTYAAMARLIGLPSRVGVGFQPGTPHTDGTFEVRDKNAHAWPEIYLEGLGWTAFEPTPSAANPTTQSVTGVPYTPPPAVPAAGTQATTPGAATTTTTAPAAAAVTTTTTRAPASTSTVGDVLGTLARIAAVVAGVALVVGLMLFIAHGVVTGRTRRRREAAVGAAARIELAWTEAFEALALVRVRRRSTETLAEVVKRVRAEAGVAEASGMGTAVDVTALDALAELLAGIAYAPDLPTTDDAVVAADAARDAIHAKVSASLPRWRRRLQPVDIRPALAEALATLRPHPTPSSAPT